MHLGLTLYGDSDNYTTTVHQVPSETSTIQGAVDAAMQTNFIENIELIELAIWHAQQLNNAADEISYLELLLTIKRESTVFEKLAEAYRKEKN